MGGPNLPNSPGNQEGKANKPKSILSEIGGFLKESLYSLLPKQWSEFLKKIESYFDDPKTETKSEAKTTHNDEHAHEQVATAPEEPKYLDIGNNMHADKEILAYFGINENTPKTKIQTTIEKQLISINFLGKSISVQPVLAEKLKSIEPELKEAFQKAGYTIDTIGSQNWRCISPHRNLPPSQSRKLSNHAFGLAIDIDPKRNPYKKFAPGEPVGEIGKHPEIIAIFKSVGLEWGGDWDPENHGHGQDAMHFQFRVDGSTPNPHLNKITKPPETKTKANTINSQQQLNSKNTEAISGKKTLLIGETDPNKVSTISIHFHGAPYQITDEEYFARYEKNPPRLNLNQTNLYPANSLTLKSEKFTDYIANAKTKYPNAAIELTAHSFGGQTLLTNNKEAILNLKPSKLTLSDPVIYPENLETLMQLLENGTEIALSYGNTQSTSKNKTIPNFCQKLKIQYPNSELIMSGGEIVGLRSVNPKIYIIENSQTPYKNHEQAKNNIAFLQNELDKSA
jgi:hypothetical protein